MKAREFKRYLKGNGATLVGIGDITQALTKEIAHLDRGIAIAVNRNLNKDTIKDLKKLQRLAAVWLKDKGFRTLSIPPDSDRIKDKFITKLYKLFCHKTAATCSGLGWVGKSGLIINKKYGSKLSWATVLTNAPFETDKPTVKSECRDCDLCVKYCPSRAINGHLWSIGEPLREIVNYEKCSSLKKERLLWDGKPNCGLCSTICPYTRNGSTVSSRVRRHDA